MAKLILRTAAIIWLLGCLAFYCLISFDFSKNRMRLIGGSVQAELVQLSRAASSIVQRKDIWQ
jgi:hypothetical protein